MSECELPKYKNSPEDIRKILETSKTIAVVGLSPKPERPSQGIYFYLKSQGYNVFGVNPGISELRGDKVYGSLKDIPVPIDIVDIFRAPDAVPEIVEESIKLNVKCIWMQEGIVHNQAAEKAMQSGIFVVMNRCIFKDHKRIFSL